MPGISIRKALTEYYRQQTTKDDLWHKKKPYVFSLVTLPGKGPAGPTGTAYFPLPLNPDNLEINYPFAGQVTLCQDGGVVVEENGILTGTIRISATTGWHMRKTQDTSTGPGDGKLTGLMATSNAYQSPISGQMHAWRLVHRLFGAYGALVQDPQTSAKTHMEFHSLKDRLHLKVIPRNVSIRRDRSEARLTYRLNIELEIVGAAEKAKFLAPGKTALQKIKDMIADGRKYANMLSAQVDELTAVAGELKGEIAKISGIIDSAGQLVSACNDFITGVKSFVDIPAGTVSSLTDLVDEAGALAANVTDWDAQYEAFQSMGDQIDGLSATFEGHFDEGLDAKTAAVDNVATRSQGLNQSSWKKAKAAKDAAASSGGAMSSASAYGSEFKPSDYDKLKAETGAGSSAGYNAFAEHTVKQGDTLQSIAAQHMGSPSSWIDVALANGLRPPYVTQGARVPNAVRPGDPILIPIHNPAAAADVSSTGNPAQGASQIEDQLGVDLLLVRLDTGKYGWAVDSQHGSESIRRVRGAKNLSQALAKRVRTEQGTNVSFPEVGLPRLIGESIFGGADSGSAYAMASYELHRQIEAEDRIQRVANMTFTVDKDALTAVIYAVPVGYDTSRAINVTLT